MRTIYSAENVSTKANKSIKGVKSVGTTTYTRNTKPFYENDSEPQQLSPTFKFSNNDSKKSQNIVMNLSPEGFLSLMKTRFGNEISK